MKYKGLWHILRLIISFPFCVLGALGIKLAEIISGEKIGRTDDEDEV